MVARDEGGTNRQSTGGFQGSETILHDAIMVDTFHYKFIQTHRMYNSKRELLYKLQTLGVNCQCTFTKGTNVHLVGDVDSGGGWPCVGAEVHGESLCLLSVFL